MQKPNDEVEACLLFSSRAVNPQWCSSCGSGCGFFVFPAAWAMCLQSHLIQCFPLKIIDYPGLILGERPQRIYNCRNITALQPCRKDGLRVTNHKALVQQHSPRTNNEYIKFSGIEREENIFESSVFCVGAKRPWLADESATSGLEHTDKSHSRTDPGPQNKSIYDLSGQKKKKTVSLQKSPDVTCLAWWHTARGEISHSTPFALRGPPREGVGRKTREQG